MDQELCVQPEGSLLRITLNRPAAINALSFDMVAQLRRVLTGIDSKSYSAILIDGAGDRGFCGGGDVKQLRSSDDDGARAFLATEYDADLLINETRTPIVTVMTGVTMGGGIGLGAHASHRIVTETSRLAMPETRIGLAPDVGANALFAETPLGVGEYFACTARSFTGAQAISLGFADYLVPHERLSEIRSVLAAGEAADQALASFVPTTSVEPFVPEGPWVEECFGVDSVVEAIQCLERHESEAARDAAEEIRSFSPLAVAVSFWAVRLARRGATLEQVLHRDLRAMTTLLRDGDAREGIRALLIDKELAPRWGHSRIEDVTVAQLQHVLGAEVLELLSQNRV